MSMTAFNCISLLFAHEAGRQSKVVSMKLGAVVFIMLVGYANAASSKGIYLLSKRLGVDTTQSLVVLFHDKAVTTMNDCQREIQRGIRDQWRYYQHVFPRQAGYSEKRDYLCITSPIQADPWDKNAPFDYIYQVDLRGETAVFHKKPSLAICLRDLRQSVRDETRTFFCGKFSQTLSL
jgi:hypothetical protein